MLKRVFIILLAIAAYMPASAQHDAGANDTTLLPVKSHLRISLLTCSPGEEIWETFGHTCIRIIDSAKSGRGKDVVYDYGFMDSSPDNTVAHQFLTGRAQVYLATHTIDEFMFQYTDEKRGMNEQVFLLDDGQKERILSFLENNLRRENKYYEYNTFHDNCSTRVLDLFMKIFGKRFVPAEVIPENSRLTFRDLTSRYCPSQHKYWFGLGMEVFYGSRSDKIVSNTEAMFLPDYLSDDIGRATINGKKLCGDKITILESKISWPATPDGPFIIFLIVAIVTISGLLVKRFYILGNLMSFLVLFSSGLLGCYMLYLWIMDGEPAWKDNLNILWALPTNIFIPFYGARVKAKYAIAAISLLGVSLILHILRVQQIPLFEIASLLLTLLLIYGMMYRKGTWKTKTS